MSDGKALAKVIQTLPCATFIVGTFIAVSMRLLGLMQMQLNHEQTAT